MSKLLYCLRNTLLLILLVLNVRFVITYGVISTRFLMYIIIFVILILLNLKDIIRKDILNENKIYNILFIFIELIMIFIFMRALYDTNFMYTNNYYREIIEDISLKNNVTYIEQIKQINMLYLYQNTLYFIAMLILLLIYRLFNKNETISKDKAKYSMISIICLLISFILPLFIIQSGGSNILYLQLAINIILLIIEIYRLIKDNYQKYEWITYLSFLFNLISFILIFALI